MHTFETRVQELKHDVLREVANLAWEDKSPTAILDIAEKIIPGPNATMRCCIYKERAIIDSRVKLAMGGDKTNPSLVEVLNIACDECPVTEMTVGPACRGCIATRCVHSCPVDAIVVVNHRAQIDHDKCIVCGKCLTACPYGAITKNLRPCEKGCPVGAISMGKDKKADIDHNKCISCGTCTNQCPFGAIMDKSYILEAIDLIKGAKRWDYKVYAMVAPSIAGQFEGVSLEQVAAGLKKLGFAAVCEAAQGADMVADHESAELCECGTLASSCCPAFVEYVEKNFPEQAGMISKTPSPMVMMARHIKEQDPAAKVVFIGPCIAKKKEAQLGKTMGSVDCVLTFEELDALLDSKKIELSALKGEALEGASGYGRSFAVSGGVSAAVARAMKERGETSLPLKSVPCSGIEACKIAFLKMARGMGDGNFIEGMACEGGCVQGPANLIRSPKNKMELEKHAKLSEKKDILK
ncbi:MAG: 4Fe-4S dicluster domain-containing protein [Oscillospiraceae bacterium]